MFSQLSSSEYVGRGHPDKVADQIADAILDYGLQNSKYNQISVEVLVSNNLVVIAGEIYSEKSIDFEGICKRILKKYFYNVDNFQFIINVSEQSADIRNSVVSNKLLISSGDQGIVFGFACDETTEYLPLSYVIARDLIYQAHRIIDTNSFAGIKDDIKSLITIKNKEIDTLIFSIQHTKDLNRDNLLFQIEEKILKPIIVEKYKYDLSSIKNKLINSSGSFIIGGLLADSGQNNRKIMVDNGGSISRHGGGGLSGKDLSKIDRLGFYFARWICKNLVAAKVCSAIELQLIYALGSKEAITYSIFQSSNKKYDNCKLISCIKEVFPTSIDQIIELFLCKNISYEDLAINGHIGRNDIDLPWENLNKVNEINSWLDANK